MPKHITHSKENEGRSSELQKMFSFRGVIPHRFVFISSTNINAASTCMSWQEQYILQVLSEPLTTWINICMCSLCGRKCISRTTVTCPVEWFKRKLTHLEQKLHERKSCNLFFPKLQKYLFWRKRTRKQFKMNQPHCVKTKNLANAMEWKRGGWVRYLIDLFSCTMHWKFENCSKFSNVLFNFSL